MIHLVTILAENLACARAGRVVFRDLNFRFEPEQVISVEGPNGAGKSSLLRMLAGFLEPSAGTLRFKRDSGTIEDGEERGKCVGWLGHQDGIKPQMTPREVLRFYAQLFGIRQDIMSKIEQSCLDEVGLARAGDLPCQYLSAGQRRRLALARLKMMIRPVWLLDEPLAALDEQGKALLRDWIDGYRATGGILIAATHEPLGVDCARLILGAP